MLIRFGFEITIYSDAQIPMMLALSTHPDAGVRLIGGDFVRTEPHTNAVEYFDRFNNRFTRIISPTGPLTLWSDCVAEVDGLADEIVPDAIQHRIEELPSEVLTHLTASRYCDADNISDFAWRQFGGTQPGWPRVQAICDFVHDHITFGYRFGRPTKTASDALLEKTGVCRDFAHLAVTLCRAMNIPARYASGYLGDIGVPASDHADFCAWFEVYLGWRWYTLDARHNTPRIGRILMVRGGDAADVAMITSFGTYNLTGFRVWTDEIAPDLDDAAILRMLQTRPHPEPLAEASSARIL